jgi:hypothetical protein
MTIMGGKWINLIIPRLKSLDGFTPNRLIQTGKIGFPVAGSDVSSAIP